MWNRRCCNEAEFFKGEYGFLGNKEKMPRRQASIRFPLWRKCKQRTRDNFPICNETRPASEGTWD